MTSRIIVGDCIEGLRMLPDASVDAMVTDPPYCSGAVGEAQRTGAKGQGLRSETRARLRWFTGDNMGTAGLVALLRAVAFESMRVVKPEGSAVFFCDWRMVSSVQPAIESAGLRYQGLVVWDKGSLGLGLGFRPQHELALHFTYGAPVYHDKGTSNVIRCRRVHASQRLHPTEKPVELLRQLVRVVAPRGGVVLDPFCGSGSTGEAAIAEGCSFIGLERDADYAAVARKRVTGGGQ